MSFPSRRPWLAIILSVLVFATIGFGVAWVEIDSSIRTMLVVGDEAYDAHRRHVDVFGTDEILSIAISFEDALSAESLDAQEELVEAIESIGDVLSVESLVMQDELHADSEGLRVSTVGDIFRSLDRTGWGIEYARERVRGHSMWSGWLVSNDLRTVALQVELDGGDDALLRRSETLLEIENAVSGSLGDVDFHFAGHPFMKAEIARSISNDISRLLPVTILAMAVVLLLATRSFVVGMAAVFSVVLSAFLMVAAMGWLGLGVTALSNAAPTILIALSTASFLHFISAYQRHSSRRVDDRVRLALADVVIPTWIAATTTSLGYSSLALSSVPIVREFGISLSAGVMISAAVGTFFLPATLCVFGSNNARKHRANGSLLEPILLSMTRFAMRSPGLIFGASVLVTALMIGLASRVEVDSSGPRRFSEESRYRVSADFYRKNLSGDVVENVYLKTAVGGFLEPDRLRRLSYFTEAAEGLDQVDKAISVSDIVRRLSWVIEGEPQSPPSIPETEAGVAQLLLLYESSAKSDSLSDFVSVDRSRAKVLIKADVQSSSESAALWRDLDQLARRFFPEEVDQHSVLSTEILLSRAADVIAVEQVVSAAVALMLVLIFVAVSFRSLSVPALMVLPNIMPLAIVVGGMAIFGFPLSDATSIIAATSIGIAVDSTVHLLAIARRVEEKSGSRTVAVLSSMIVGGRPVLISSFVVVSGFSLLLLSDFRSVQELGALTAMTMICCLLADLIVLPGQLFFFSETYDGCDVARVELDGNALIFPQRENWDHSPSGDSGHSNQNRVWLLNSGQWAE